MFSSLSQVLDFIESTSNSRNFVDREKIINAGHFIFSGLNNQSANQQNILSYCLQSSDVRDQPHEIKTIIYQNGKIVSSKCSCTAGLSERCKHVTAVLLFLLGKYKFYRLNKKNFQPKTLTLINN